MFSLRRLSCSGPLGSRGAEGVAVGQMRGGGQQGISSRSAVPGEAVAVTSLLHKNQTVSGSPDRVLETHSIG